MKVVTIVPHNPLNSHGDLYLLKKNNKDTSKHIYYSCLCKCGKVIYKRLDCIKSNKIKSCNACKTEKTSRPVLRAINKLYESYKKSALERSISFNLPLESFIVLIVSPCFYCGEKSANKTKIKNWHYYHNGVDRLDSNLGYLENNVVPCCKTCNFGKHTQSKEQFLNWAQKIIDHQRQKTNEQDHATK